MSAGQVDGYGPGEFDDIHRDLLAGGILTLVAAGGLLFVSREFSGAASGWLVAASVVLVVIVILGCAMSSFYRRYAFLIWWRKGFIATSSTPLYLLKHTAASILAFAQTRSRGGYVPTFGTRDGTFRTGPTVLDVDTPVKPRVSEVNVGVDEDGRVYEWNAWRGRWQFRADSLTGMPVQRLRIKRTIFGSVEKPRDETDLTRAGF